MIDRARFDPKLSSLAVLGALWLVFGCTAAIGAGVAVTAAGAAVVATPCYGYVQATVIDGRTGGTTCAAELVAVSGNREERFTPCYHAPLPEGKWQIRASGGGLPDSVTDIEIPEPSECSRVVHSIVLTMGATPAPAFGTYRAAEAPPPPPIATAAPSAQPPAATPPSPPGATVPPAAAPPPPAAAPAPADAGPSGRLPDVEPPFGRPPRR